MKKPKIFVAIHYMEIGGAEISLIGLLQALDYSRVDVDLFVYRHTGELMQFIPRQVNLLPEIPEYSSIEKPIAEVLKQGFIKMVFARIIAKYCYSRFRHKKPSELPDDSGLYQYISSGISPFMPDINPETEYDLAVEFMGFRDLVVDHVRAKRYLAWIHTDYSKVDSDRTADQRTWERYDNIVSISSDVTRTFAEIYPALSPKIIEIENILSPEFVRARADEFDISFEKDCFNLLSIGRFCEAKNYDNVPDIARRIKERLSIPFKWYIIGFGDDTLVRKKIAEAGMEDTVIILGKRSNPYPYIKACDIYVQPSRYEGKSVTVREAQVLNKPVLVTAYPTAPSQVEDGVTGVIVPLDNKGCACGIANIIIDKVLQKHLSDNLRERDFGNIAEVNKIYELLDE